MVLLRRVALRALSSRPVSTSLLSTAPRTFVTCSTKTWKPQVQWTLSRFQRRFASEESTAATPAAEEATDETVTETPTEGEASLSEEASSSTATATEASETAPEEPVKNETEAAATASETEVLTTEPATEPAKEQSTLGSAASAVAGAASAVANSVRQSAPPPFGQPEHLIPKNQTLYIGNLFFETTEDDLKSFFAPCGSVESVKIIYDHRGLSKGFGYVTFHNMDDATKAIETRNQEVFQGRRLTVQYHRKREAQQNLTRPNRPNAPSKTLFIGNMSFEMSDKDLNDLFREIRNVLDVRVAIDRRSGQPRGFAHADFIDVASATRAMEVLRGKEIYGRRLRVDYSISSAAQRP